jgi:hypothetical protein
MRFVPNKQPIPRSFAMHPYAKGRIAEADIFPQPHGRLAAKLLVFEHHERLRSFWRKAMGHDVGRGCRGVVNGLCQERMRVGKDGQTYDHRLTGDPRYFCIIGLCLGFLGMEIVTHESVHAGFCYEKRVGRNYFGTPARDFDEERIAYPTGGIASAIARFLDKHDLYDRKPVRPRRRRK